MTDEIKTFDCKGCHAFCYGGYHMEEDADGYGDWVRKEDHDAVINAANARIAELEAASAQSSQQGADYWAPQRIWLQRGVGEGGSHTWCEDQIGDDIEEAEYVRVDQAALPQATDSDTQEAREILENMARSIELHGNYSAEAMCTFLRQALQCLPLLATPATTPDESDRLFILLCEIRAACGDNGEREPDELVRYIAGMRRNSERFQWMRRRAVMIEGLGEPATKITLLKEEGPTGEFLDDQIDALSQQPAGEQ